MENKKKDNKKVNLNLKDLDLKVQSFVTSVKRQRPDQRAKITWSYCGSGGCPTNPTCTT